MRKCIILLTLIVFSLQSYAQMPGKTVKQKGSIDFSKVELNVDFLQDYLTTEHRRSMATNAVNYDKIDVELMNYGGIKVLSRDEKGRPTFIGGTIVQLPSGIQAGHDGESVMRHLRKLEENNKLNLQYYGIQLAGLKYMKENRDAHGNTHFTYRQYIDNIPVYGGMIKVHLKGNEVYAINGRTYHPVEAIQAKLTSEEAMDKAYDAVHGSPAKLGDLYVEDDVAELVYYTPANGRELRLCYMLHIHPAFNQAWQIFIDARTGEVVDKWSTLCNLMRRNGPTTAVAKDLNGVDRTIHTYEMNGDFYLLDASRPMFNPGSDVMNNPIGAIWTLDGNYKFPSDADFEVFHLSTPDNNWENRTAVSAHYNAAQSYEYYRNTFDRNSIDGQGGTIISVINITDEYGNSFGNAFWNGRVMWYGNGDKYFKPLAGGLDVAGHEMTHGVITATANLQYRGESGAINESYADIFGAMIDRNDWQIGETVVNPAFGSPALRDMADPHNGGHSFNDLGYQPAHYSERYTGSRDNGGVHINSGIVNHAYYLFAKKVGKKKAEQVFYYTLVNYLGVQSDFSDLRASVEQACLDLYNNTVKKAASDAFAQVGIGGGGNVGGNDGNDYETNPGNDWVYVVNDYGNLELYDGNGNSLGVLSNNVYVKSKPSVTDDGRLVVFVTQNNEIYAFALEFGNQVKIVDQGVILDNSQGDWGNACISDDGRYVAFVSNYADKSIYVVDILKSDGKVFELYNPTNTQGVKTGAVKYADALEFDHDNQHLYYDAYNVINKSMGDDITYWNVGVINVTQNGSWGNGEIHYLLGALPEGVSIGNPAQSTNSNKYLAVDILDNNAGKYYLGIIHIFDNAAYILAENSKISYPSFNRLDNKIIASSTDNSGNEIIVLVSLKGNMQEMSSSEAFSYGSIATWFADGQRRTADVNPEHLQAFTIYPNPLEGTTTLTFQEVFSVDSKVKIYATDGTLMASYVLPAGKQSLKLPMLEYPSGTYFIHVRNSVLNTTEKVIKQ